MDWKWREGAVIREVQVLLQKVTKMPPERQHADHLYMSQPSVHPLHKARFKVSPPSFVGAWSGSAWQPASGWRWPTAQPCVWSLTSSSGTPHVVTSHGKAPQSRSGSLPAQTQIQAVIQEYFKANSCVCWIYDLAVWWNISKTQPSFKFTLCTLFHQNLTKNSHLKMQYCTLSMPNGSSAKFSWRGTL